MNGYTLTAHCYGNECDAVYAKGCNCLDEMQVDSKFKTAGGPGASPPPKVSFLRMPASLCIAAEILKKNSSQNKK